MCKAFAPLVENYITDHSMHTYLRLFCAVFSKLTDHRELNACSQPSDPTSRHKYIISDTFNLAKESKTKVSLVVDPGTIHLV